jgi:hypothetical protein
MGPTKTKPDLVPRFAADANGNTVDVLLDTASYISLLVRADVFDAGQWPPGKQEGAVLLSRIREIEHACIAAHGAFDWEKLEPAAQDEYDGLTVQLVRLHFGTETTPFEEVIADLGIKL